MDGPAATRKEIARAARDIDDGGVFGYRFFYPPMRVGKREVYWHRPLIASANGLHEASLGYVEVGGAELTPRLLEREIHRKIVAIPGPKARESARKIVDWNSSVGEWNQRAKRERRGVRGKNTFFTHLPLRGDVRPPSDANSTLHNTDGQIFSDCGIPVVLFMENYDIDRRGYHDSRDIMANIDLDYGSALVTITVETVARVASV